MIDLGSLSAKAKLLRIKLAADDTGLAGRIGGGLLGLGSLGAGIHSAISGYKAMTPSLLDIVSKLYSPGGNDYSSIFDIMHSLRTVPSIRSNLSSLQQAESVTKLQDYHKEIENLKKTISEKPKLLRKMLSGSEIPGISNTASNDFRDIAFGRTFDRHIQTKFDPLIFERPTNTKPSQPGEVFVNIDRNATKGFATGGNYSHVAISTAPGKVYDLGPGMTMPEQSLSNVMNNVKLRPVNNTSIALNASDPLLTSKLPYDYRQLGDLGLREIAPEFNRGHKNIFSPLLDFIAKHSKFVKKILPKEVHDKMLALRIGCPSGKTCSTFAGQVAEKMLPGIAGDTHNVLTPNAFMRSSKYIPESIHLSPQNSEKSFLRLQNLFKYGPLALRIPLIAGASLLGAWGLSKSLNRPQNQLTS